MNTDFMQEINDIQRRQALRLMAEAVSGNKQSFALVSVIHKAYGHDIPVGTAVRLALANLAPIGAMLYLAQRDNKHNHRLAFGVLSFRWAETEDRKKSPVPSPRSEKILAMVVSFFADKIESYDPLTGEFVLSEDDSFHRLANLLEKTNSQNWGEELAPSRLKSTVGSVDHHLAMVMESVITRFRT